jgi:hypothetical protein
MKRGKRAAGRQRLKGKGKMEEERNVGRWPSPKGTLERGRENGGLMAGNWRIAEEGGKCREKSEREGQMERRESGDWPAIIKDVRARGQ